MLIKTMKILHITPYIHPAYGGPCVAVRSMANSMKRQGAEVYIATTNAAGDQDSSLPDGYVQEEDGVIVHYFQRAFPRSWFYAPGMVRWLHAQAKKFDLLHLHVPFTAPFRWGAQAALAANRPYVATLHGLLDPWSMGQKAWKKRPYLQFIERPLLSKASGLHVTAPIEATSVEALKLGPKISCLPLAVNASAFNLMEPSNNRAERVLCIARLHPVKALPVLFEALARIRNQGKSIILDLAGDGDATYVENLQKLSYALGIAENIIWHGHIGDSKKRALYAKADCFALLSYHENFGLAAAEAMAAGLPVLVSDQVGLSPDVAFYQAGKVVPVGNIAATAEALLTLFDTEVNHRCRIQARRLAEQSYGQATFDVGLRSFYEGLCENLNLTIK